MCIHVHTLPHITILHAYILHTYCFCCRLESDLKKKQQEIEKLQKEFDDKIYLLEKQAVLDKER